MLWFMFSADETNFKAMNYNNSFSFSAQNKDLWLQDPVQSSGIVETQ